MPAEVNRKPLNGWPILLVLILAEIAAVIWLVSSIRDASMLPRGASAVMASVWIIASVLAAALVAFLLAGLFMLQPNEAGVLLLFGAYRGTVRQEGLLWANPLYTKIKISLRVRTLNMEKLKVNDQRGNPVEIAAVVVWRVANTTQAVFDVDDYRSYVATQSETALRHLASRYPYDTVAGEHELSLRGSMDEVSQALRTELQDRLGKAGVVVDEARLSHLAYTPEIAQAMLRRQQAEAVVAARTRIVEGAVGMVEMALEHLERHKTIELDAERKAAMVSNLLVVLCGDHNAQPVVNTGTLYT